MNKIKDSKYSSILQTIIATRMTIEMRYGIQTENKHWERIMESVIKTLKNNNLQKRNKFNLIDKKDKNKWFCGCEILDKRSDYSTRDIRDWWLTDSEDGYGNNDDHMRRVDLKKFRDLYICNKHNVITFENYKIVK